MTLDTETVPAPIGVAATVVLLRDSPEGPEVLLLERPRHRGSFAGAWVFPGGGVDADDRLPTDSSAPAGRARPLAELPGSAADRGVGAAGGAAAALRVEAIEELAARRAAVREVREETALEVAPETLVAAALWVPPLNVPKRLRTWFYVTAAPPGTIVLAEDEVIDCVWLRPQEALARHASASMTLVAPTWVTLHGLQGHESVAQIVAGAQQRGLAHYETRLGASEQGPALFWAGDVAYADDALAEQAGGRHRLEIGGLPWVYSADGPPAR
ncbi:NUDIX hydrolase [Cryobacterium sp. TMT1-3]|uniref:NUDIX hydrolase n=1 Tax=Cryobacterium luteum TaxID=1424661 RepID=A0A1H8ABX3_9MICO|nr:MULTISPECIES: NUDIX hydrolase [Cryobacterium]TFB88472.1 NUDIX hydrolase [Cryobacterium luteum]TFC24498.1 NUDIX hydrolase [Cryobacterium sp. TMT1-3]SEM68220.1 NUDIX domain-containing protein [Cryobacterium luteum]